MPPNETKIRVVKRSEKDAPELIRAVEAVVAPPDGDATTRTLREMQTVVSGWVVEHRKRADEFRTNYASLLKRTGFNLERSTPRG